jgi:hypothetical protein
MTPVVGSLAGGALGGGAFATHWAKSVVLAEPMAKALPAEYAVPLPLPAVFQPENMKPVRAKLPVLPSTVTDAPFAYVFVSVGAAPLVAPLLL